MSEENNGSDTTLSITNARVVDVNSMSEIEIPESNIAVVHFADVIAGAVLEKIRVFPQGRIPGGKYTLKMTAVLTPVPEEKNAVPEADDQ